MAYRAPKQNYQRNYYISTHVVDRLRLRNPDSDSISDGMIYRDHADLMNRIDDAIKSSIAAKKVHHIWDRGEPGRLIIIEDWFLDGTSIYILLKRDAKNERMWAAITVFTEQQFESNKRNCRWTWAETPHPEILPPRITNQPAPVSVSVKTAGTFSQPVQVERKLPLAINEMVLFYYKTKDGDERFERHVYRDAAEHGNRIINSSDYLEGSLETYSRLRTELKANRRPIDF